MFRNLIVYAFVLLPCPAAANLILNGSFESPAMPANAFCSVAAPSLPPPCPAPLDNWLGAYLVGNGGTAYGAPQPGPDGAQHLILQGNSGATPISQLVNLPVTGNFILTWFDAGRFDGGSFGGNQSYEIRLDGIAVGSFSTTTSQLWTARSHSFAANAGPHTFSIFGLANTDQTAFLDNFVLLEETDGSIPEPGTATTFVLGLVVLLVLRPRTR